jgi:hypothetical protein
MTAREIAGSTPARVRRRTETQRVVGRGGLNPPAGSVLCKRRGRDSDPGERLCRPSPNHSATAPKVSAPTPSNGADSQLVMSRTAVSDATSLAVCDVRVEAVQADLERIDY